MGLLPLLIFLHYQTVSCTNILGIKSPAYLLAEQISEHKIQETTFVEVNEWKQNWNQRWIEIMLYFFGRSLTEF